MLSSSLQEFSHTTSSQGYPKRSFVAKCLSSVHNLCKLDGSIPVYPEPLSTWKGPSKRCLSSCDCRFLVGFPFSVHIPPFGLWQSVANGHFDKDDQLSTTKGVDMNMHYGTNSSLLLVISWTATVFEASF